MTRTVDQITLGELMSEDHDVYLKNDNRFGFVLEIDNENGEPVSEEGLHPFAAEGMALFCKRYLSAYERAVERAEAQ